MERWLCEKLKTLKDKENRITNLTEIRSRVNENLNLDPIITERLLTHPDLFDCVEDEETTTDAENNSKVMVLVTDILRRCMNNLCLIRNSDLFRLLHRTLFHKAAHVRALGLIGVLREVYKQIVDNNMHVNDVISMELLHHVLVALQDQDAIFGNTASKILCIVLDKYIDEPSIKAAILEALKQSGVVKCRLYELAVELGNRSSAILEKVEFILDHALSELDNDDVLLQVSILGTLRIFAKQDIGLSYLENRQVFDVLAKRIEEMDYHPLDRLLIPGLMKFFATQPKKVITSQPHVMRYLFTCFESGDNAMLPTAFDTLVNLTRMEQGVLLLDRHYADNMKDVFETYSHLIKVLPIDLKIRAFDSLRFLFLFEDKLFPELGVILQRWFNYLCNDAHNIQFLFEYCRHPNTKRPALGFLRSICYYSWGVEALKNTAGFMDNLLERDIDNDDGVKYIKYCIVNILANSSAFDAETISQLREYVNEGPYFAPIPPEGSLQRN